MDQVRLYVGAHREFCQDRAPSDHKELVPDPGDGTVEHHQRIGFTKKSDDVHH